MEQAELRAWERRCIQEEPPECRAACPLHVDARGMIGHIAQGNWDAALAVLRKNMPLPAILGRICDAPCRRRCKRGQAGEPIQIGLLERACVSRPAAAARLMPLPRRNQRVAVLGSGLSSLTAAWDLGRKGYAVTLIDPDAQPALLLQQRFGGLLARTVIDEQIALLHTLGLTLLTSQTVDPARIEDWLASYDALYIGRDGWAPAADSDLARMCAELPIDERTRAAERAGLYLGGADPSPVMQAAQGRWAATSIDRWLQKVSLGAGREGEGPQPTRLFTSLVGVAPQPAVAPADPAAGYQTAEAVAEAQRCLLCECLECVKVCAYLESFGAYPRKYAREIYNNESIVLGSRAANKLINSCSLCGLCEAVCPENFAMQTLCLTARRNMVTIGKMPPSAHEFALDDMRYSQGAHFQLARHAPGATTSAYLFFPGCQLCASAPQMAAAVYDHLRAHIEGGVGLMLDCCGAPAYWAGRQEQFAAARAAWHARWEALGRPTLITACSSCQLVFSQEQPTLPLLSLWEVLHAAPAPTAVTYALHDPCTTRDVPHVQAAVRRLLAAQRVTIAELPLSRELTECCGFGGLMQFANPAVAQAVVTRRAALAPHDYVTYCAMCRDNLVMAGKRCLHLLDLLFPAAAGDDPAGRPRPGWSRRRDQRAWLKQHLLTTLWQEKGTPMEAHRRLKLSIAPELAALLEQRRILEEDLQLVIAAAEKSGRKLRDPLSGRYKANYKPVNVTFWVEYAPDGDGFVVFNAYAHRMEVTG